MSNSLLPYDPGVLPERESPKSGDIIEMTIKGLPPIKSARESLRNPKSRKYDRFTSLRKAATETMAGRAWYFGGVIMNVKIHKRMEDEPKITLNDYIGGIMDTLDGSSGVHFTYLPIVYEDDCQVVSLSSEFVESVDNSYTIQIKFI